MYTNNFIAFAVKAVVETYRIEMFVQNALLKHYFSHLVRISYFFIFFHHLRMMEWE